MPGRLQRKSITSRPSHNLPVDRPKNKRPFGGLTGKPRPAASPPVSELESPKLKMTGRFPSQPEAAWRTEESETTTAKKKKRRRETREGDMARTTKT